MRSMFGGADLTAILIVNGGNNPRSGRWLELCLQRIAAHSGNARYAILVWNNNVADVQIPKIVSGHPHALLVQADPQVKLPHVHATPLQRLYEIAREQKARYVITLDSDAFPVKDGWLTSLTKALDSRTVISGVWRDELSDAIRPYIHPSCLCTTMEFIESRALRFDTVDLSPEKKMDTLSSFTSAAEAASLQVHKLKRSNRNNMHYLMAGIYGDLIYHHGAGSRKKITFWGEPRTDDVHLRNEQLRETIDQLIFENQAEFIQWLRGMYTGGRTDRQDGQDHHTAAELDFAGFCLSLRKGPAQ